MSANDISQWMNALRQRLAETRQRHLVVFQGGERDCQQFIDCLAEIPVPSLLLSDRPLGKDPVGLRLAAGCLGRETSLVLLDLLDGVDPDLICLAAGLVTAGGVLIIFCRGEHDLVAMSGGQSAQSAQPGFERYLLQALRQEAAVASLVSAGSSLPPLPDLPALEPVAFKDGLTAGQRNCLAAIRHWLKDGEPGVALLSADRGRGKSTCLGLLLADLPANCRVLFCADSRRQAEPALRHAPDVDFLAPDRLLLTAPAADLVVVDEAAMIPQSLLRQMTAMYPRLLLATTTAGYEGTGRGFLLRFIADLDPAKRLQLTLDEPVRWCAGDAMENCLNRVLQLDDTRPARQPREDEVPVSIEVLEQPGVDGEVEKLLDAYRLLRDAHYRTRPSDLRRLMEDPELMLLLACRGEQLVGAALINREGGFDEELCTEVFLGRRRPKGHLLAQMLTAQAGIPEFAAYRGLRIQRIAVVDACRRQGVATALIRQLQQYAIDAGCDYTGASFALDAVSAGFWQRVGYSLAHVGFAQGKSSGSHSLAVLAPLRESVESDLARLQQRIQRQLPVWMTQFLGLLDTGQVVSLLRMARFDADLSALERDEINAFARGHKGFEFCFASLQRFAMERIGSMPAAVDPLLVAKAVQNRPWERLERERGDLGRRQLQNRLRELILQQLDDDSAGRCDTADGAG